MLQLAPFSFQNNMFQPEQGISVGSPISSTIVEIFLQHLENIRMRQQLDTKTIACYTRYVVDILLIYKTKHITFDKINECINQIHPNLILNPTRESNNSISFLDLLIVWNQSNLEIDIYRKPTTTDINFFSNHLTEHEMAAYQCHINRML